MKFMKKCTLKDIAKEVGVSAMTVSKVLNNKPGVSDATRQQVQDAARRLNYSQNLIARSLRTDETRTLGVVLSDTSEMVLSKVLRGIQDGASAKNYSTIIANTDHQPEREQQAIQTLLGKRIDGLILVAPTLYTDEQIALLKSSSIPFIFLMRKSDHSDIDTIINDNYLGGYQSVVHLIENRCRSFAFLALKDSQSSQDREKGYLQALADYRVPLESVHFFHISPFIEAAEAAARELLQSGIRFDALVCGCDTVAVGAMNVLLDAGIRIPADVRLIGYDGIDLARYLRVPLTTMEQPLYEIGHKGAEILIDRAHYPQMPVRKLVLKSQLVIRQSTLGR